MRIFRALALLLLFVLMLSGAAYADQNDMPFLCMQGSVKAPIYVRDFAVGSYVPCGWKVTLPDVGRVWGIEGSNRVLLTVSPYFGNDNCMFKPINKLKARHYGWTVAAKVKVIKSPCVLWVNLDVDYGGLRWSVYLWDVNIPLEGSE